MLEEDIYKTIDVAGEGIYSEKRSKFLAFAIPVQTLDDVKREVEAYQKKYYELKYSSRNEYRRCVECGKMIEIKNKKDFSTKYCKECAYEKHKVINRENMRKSRANKKSVQS